MHSTHKTCLYCNKPLPTFAVGTLPLCRGTDCAWKYAIVPENQRCVVCARALSHSETARRTCSNNECWKAHAVGLYRKLEAANLAHLNALGTEWRNRCAPVAQIENEALFDVFIIPHNPARVRALPHSRREAFREHLVNVATRALAEIEASSESDASLMKEARNSNEVVAAAETTDMIGREVADTMGHACASCRGHCCGDGGNHAYLSVSTIANYIRYSGITAVSEIVDNYMRHVESRTFSKRCIYQHASGCTLPRVMRSNTCNDFFCSGLRQYQLHAQSNKAFFIPTRDEQFQSGVFADSAFVRIVRRKDLQYSSTQENQP